MERGDVLKLTEEGLDCMCGGDEGKRLMLASRRFEYRCKEKNRPDSITVKRLYGGRSYTCFHRTFLEPA
jgi:hypothetical protein